MNNIKLSEATLKQYNCILNKIDIDKITLDNFDKVLDMVHTHVTNKNSVKVYLSAILYHIRQNNIDIDIEKYQNKIKLLSLEIQNEIEKNKLSDKQKKNYLSWSQILDIKEKVKKELEDANYKSKPKYKFYTIMSLYTQLPPRRLLDYANLKFYNRKPIHKKINKDENYLILNKKAGYLLFNNYKTSKVYKTQKIDLPPQLLKELKKYVEQNRLIQGEVLFGLDANYLGKHISQQMQKYSGVPVTVNIMRHSFITNLDNNKISVKKRKTIAKKMAHSVELQLLYSKHKG